MPYSTNKDLNARTKKMFPEANKQNAFRESFNSALSHYGDEHQAFAVATAAAERAHRVPQVKPGDHRHHPGEP